MTAIPPIRLQASIVARTTLKIIGLSLIVGLLAILVSMRLIETRERERLNANLDQLVATIERTASVAAFAGDRQLATEVVTGLRHNESVLAVRILSGDELLASSGNSAAGATPTELPAISRPLYSPFSPEEVIGRIEIEPAREKIRDEATRFAYFVGTLLAVLVAVVAAAVAWVVYRSVTHPIKRIADRLHMLDVQHGA